MDKRKILAVKASVLAVAAVFGAPSHVAAADTSVQFYGHLDLSVDGATKGIKEGGAGQNPAPEGKVGWQADVSSNLSYFGFRGDHDIGRGYKMVFQVETQVDVAATPGPSPVNQASQGNVDNKVLAALGSRNSFLGIAGNFGAFKLGKTDAPYKLSTARMDPFSATVGDYNSIMGNTGGDNRAEFDTRLSHAMWYESPKWGGASFSALWAPVQNRASDNSINASGEPDCTGGGGTGAGPCNDGSFGDAYSVAGVYEAGPLYGILAYELHRKANRVVDEHPATVGDVGVGDEGGRPVHGHPQYHTQRDLREDDPQSSQCGLQRAATQRFVAGADSKNHRSGRPQRRMGARSKKPGAARLRGLRGNHQPRVRRQRVQHVHGRIQASFRQAEQLVCGVCPPGQQGRRALRP